MWDQRWVVGLAVSGGQAPPAVVFTAPVSGAIVNTRLPQLELAFTPGSAAVDPASVELTANGEPLPASCTGDETGATCTPSTALPERSNSLTATVADVNGQRSDPAQVTFTVDTIAPAVTLAAPADGLVTNQPQQSVAGDVSEAASLTVKLNGQAVESFALGAAGAFSASPVTLTEGGNVVEVVALDAAGHTGRVQAAVTLDTVAPEAAALTALVVGPVTDGSVTVDGAAGSVEGGAQVTLTNRRTGAMLTVVAGADGRFSATLAAEAGDRIAITVADAAGNTSVATEVEAGLPSDPAAVAPGLDATGVTSLAEATAFLYTGANPIQTGVAAGTIEARRAAVLRGVVRARDGAALGGVTITVLGHPELGQTVSRVDGAFDLAVNGGGVLTVAYAKAGYLPAQRQVAAPWQDYAHLPAVVLIPLDAQVTTLTANATGMQVARGTAVTDADGTRRATVLMPAGTTATMVRPDGTTQALTTLSVRATEYTVGASGPQAMPAALPPTSGYTYAVEFSVDEALTAGATSVQFSQPVVSYTENFLGFPVGWVVPAGWYDRARAAWVPGKNGRVIKLLAVTGGLADLDTDGDGLANSATALSALGVTEAERQHLATLYPVGQTLWRVPVAHFSPWDFNWPFGPPTDAVPPGQPLTQFYSENTPTVVCGSILECQNQTLGEAIALTGTPFALHYRSDRVPGRTTDDTLTIPLSGATIPASLTRIDLEVSVAGRRVTQRFPAAANQATTFTWDGRDAYGRLVSGAQPLAVRIGYVYPLVYQAARGDFEASFAVLAPGASTVNRPSGEVTRWQDQRTTVGRGDARAAGLGGWTLTPHHAYDPLGADLARGDGRRRSGRALSVRLMTAAGTGTAGFSGDGGSATQAQLNGPQGLAVGPDGSLYLADTFNIRIRRVAPDGRITTVAGSGSPTCFGCAPIYGGDGGPATQALLDRPWDVAVGADGSLFIADTENHRIRRVDPAGIITTVAGTGVKDAGGAGRFGGEGGPAAQADLNFPAGLGVAPDGRLAVADTSNQRVRRLVPSLPGFASGELAIAAEDGALVDVFDGRGRHLRTVDALTGAVVARFTYDATGWLTGVEDRAGLVTRIERDGAGAPTALVAPGGQRTALALDANGYLASVTDPAGQTTRMTSGATGLLATRTDPKGQEAAFTYDAQGRLTRDDDAAGGARPWRARRGRGAGR